MAAITMATGHMTGTFGIAFKAERVNSYIGHSTILVPTVIFNENKNKFCIPKPGGFHLKIHGNISNFG